MTAAKPHKTDNEDKEVGGRSIAWRFLAGLTRTMVTLGALGIAGTAVAALTEVLANRAEAVEGPAAEPPVGVMTVRAERVESYAVTRRFVGIVEPVRTTQLAFELPGVIERVHSDEGDFVAKGALIAEIDTALLEADRARFAASIAALDARLELARRTLARQSELNARGFASEQRLDEAALTEAELVARIAEAKAALVNVDVRI